MEGDGPVRVGGFAPTLPMPAMQQWQVGLWVGQRWGRECRPSGPGVGGEAKGETRSEGPKGQLGSWWPGEVTAAGAP